MLTDHDELFEEVAAGELGADFAFRGKTLRAVIPDGITREASSLRGRARVRLSAVAHVLKSDYPLPPLPGEDGTLNGEPVRVSDRGSTDSGPTWEVNLIGA